MLQKDSKGQFLLDQACDALRLAEREYFGLRYVDQQKQRVRIVWHMLWPVFPLWRKIPKIQEIPVFG